VATSALGLGRTSEFNKKCNSLNIILDNLVLIQLLNVYREREKLLTKPHSINFIHN